MENKNWQLTNAVDQFEKSAQRVELTEEDHELEAKNKNIKMINRRVLSSPKGLQMTESGSPFSD